MNNDLLRLVDLCQRLSDGQEIVAKMPVTAAVAEGQDLAATFAVDCVVLFEPGQCGANLAVQRRLRPAL